jgi:hypothetical protein
MKTNYASVAEPTVGIAINKSKLKLYNKNSNVPVYYLQKGQEFQIEIFNPTSDTILAKINLNSKMISQGGLVLRPSERVFLDRYFDVSKKFKFDTYEVGNSEAVKQAIQDNGDVKVEFYREQQVNSYYYNPVINLCSNNHTGTFTRTPLIGGTCNATYNSTSFGYNSNNTSSIANTVTTTVASFGTMDMLSDCAGTHVDIGKKKTLKRSLSASKSIETGRVEQGSESNQKFQSVNKKFEYLPFHIVEYKLLPISQKINTSSDMKVKIYCGNCGAKANAGDKFCRECGNKH